MTTWIYLLHVHKQYCKTVETKTNFYKYFVQIFVHNIYVSICVCVYSYVYVHSLTIKVFVTIYLFITVRIKFRFYYFLDVL